ncbi:hypothetical protein CL629_02310 [bacterium]|nr:hypothetical protein [bacterium]|tara:strand:- start:2571 stop:2873 length:303 start_codon:yes stop_codon:yes gene_type:complete
MLNQVDVLFCRKSGPAHRDEVEFFGGVVECTGSLPKEIFRLEKIGFMVEERPKWTPYRLKRLFIARKDGVYSEIVVYVLGEIEEPRILELLVETFDTSAD